MFSRPHILWQIMSSCYYLRLKPKARYQRKLPDSSGKRTLHWPKMGQFFINNNNCNRLNEVHDFKLTLKAYLNVHIWRILGNQIINICRILGNQIINHKKSKYRERIEHILFVYVKCIEIIEEGNSFLEKCILTK